MKTIDLVKLEGAVDEELMEHMLRADDVELVFNGRLVWGDIVAAIVAAKRALAAPTPSNGLSSW